MKTTTKTDGGKKSKLKGLVDQTNVISALCKQGIAEEKANGKVSAKTHREAKQAVAKLGKLIAAL